MHVQLSREGTTLHGELTGLEQAPLLAFIHGGFMDRHMFDGQAQSLVQQGHQVLTWDLRGHGASLPRGKARPSVADMTEDLFALLDELTYPEPVVLIGQSLGGMIAQRAALTAPERVAGLVTIGSPCINPEDAKLRRRMAAVWRMSALVTGLLPTSAIRRQLPRGTAVTAPAKQYVRTATATITKADFLWLTQASRQAGQGLQSRRIDQPQLIIRGASDTSGSGRLTALTASHWMARDQNARYEVIPGAGHQAHQDQPEVFDRLLLDFLNG